MVDAPEARSDFARWGYPRWWGIVTGGMEILSAVLIALPVSRIVGVAPAATERAFQFPAIASATAASETSFATSDINDLSHRWAGSFR
ncbi:hypothetical protein ACVIDN_000449 [Rhizobium brockwellii]